MDVVASGSRDDPNPTTRTIVRKELFIVLKSKRFFKLSSKECIKELVNYITDKFFGQEQSVDLQKKLQNIMKVFVSKLLKKWKESKRIYDRFLKINEKWLQGHITLPTNPLNTTPRSYRPKGRPKNIFGGSSKRTMLRRIKSLASEKTPEELCFAAESSLARSGKRTAAHVVNMALTTTPKRLKKMKIIHDTSTLTTITKYTAEEALAMIVDLGLGKEDYVTLQRGAKCRGANIYPAYNVIAETKKLCYPSNIIITETRAKVPLQDLLDLTVQRLVQVQFEVIKEHVSQDAEIEIIYKWGFDGSGGHSIYKQNFRDHIQYGDANILLCTIVVLEMLVFSGAEKKILWKNISPSSTKHCRPIEFQLRKETNEATKDIYNTTQREIAELRPTKVFLSGRELNIKHKLVCTMMNGKTCNVLTDTASSQRCNVCKASPKEMNNLQIILEKPCDTSTYKFGFPILHAYIRCFEYLLHIAYKLDIKQWQARGKETQEKIKTRKNKIVSAFYEEMGLVIDQPKQGGGNSNDGNTARKFFENSAIVSRITGLDEILIQRFANILSTLSSCHAINSLKFKKYCIETAEMCIELYGWYNMTASVHKILIHGSDIIETLPLPIGQLSEDVLEARQKDYKYIRLFHSRKTSRVETNTDIFHWMLISSDPVISAKRKPMKKKSKPFKKEVLEMLEVPDLVRFSEDTDINDTSDTQSDDDED